MCWWTSSSPLHILPSVTPISWIHHFTQQKRLALTCTWKLEVYLISLESKNTEQLTTPTLLFIIHYNYIRFAFLFFNIRFSAHGEPQCSPELLYDLAPLNFLRDASANSQRSWIWNKNMAHRLYSGTILRETSSEWKYRLFLHSKAYACYSVLKKLNAL